MTALKAAVDALEAQITELSDSDLSGEKLGEAVSRARAISECSSQIIRAGDLLLRAETLRVEYGQPAKIPPMLTEE